MRYLLVLSFLLPANLATGQEYLLADETLLAGASMPCISETEQARMDAEVEANIRSLQGKGILKMHKFKTTAVLYDWPLAQDAAFHYNAVYAITNFIDHNLATGQLQDHNCGTRTYDGHNGTDISLWPFPINMMERSQVHVVAAAPGTIVAKHDGEFDHQCTKSNATSNYVVLQHSDGYRTHYLHMKTGSVTTKAIGATVVAGEQLGLVASSGSSTGPHLHFEVRDNNNTRVDPWMGSCNTGTSLWNNQKPYYESQINTLMTHHKAPGIAGCPLPDTINARDSFYPGSEIYFAAYHHDLKSGQATAYSIERPDGSLYHSWNYTPTSSYTVSRRQWPFTLPGTELLGMWKFKAIYQGQTHIHPFYIVDPTKVLSVGRSQGYLFPNPVSNTLYFSAGDYTSTRNNTVTISNLQGQILMKANAHPKTTAVHVSSLPPGIYLLQVGTERYKFVKD